MSGHRGNDYGNTHKKVFLSRKWQRSGAHCYVLKLDVVSTKMPLSHTKIEQTEMWAEHTNVTMY